MPDTAAVLEFLEHGRTTACDLEQVDLPFPVKPMEYLGFAKEDLSGTETRHFVNALSNAKRALHCQVDALLIALGLYESAKREGLPAKMERLREVGVVAPGILDRINRNRNLMEHEYALPDRRQVMDAVDTVELFIGSTRELLLDFPKAAFCESEQADYILCIEFRRDAALVHIERKYPRNPVYEHLLSIDFDAPEYPAFVKAYLAAHERRRV